MYKKQVRKQL